MTRRFLFFIFFFSQVLHNPHCDCSPHLSGSGSSATFAFNPVAFPSLSGNTECFSRLSVTWIGTLEEYRQTTCMTYSGSVQVSAAIALEFPFLNYYFFFNLFPLVWLCTFAVFTCVCLHVFDQRFVGSSFPPFFDDDIFFPKSTKDKNEIMLRTRFSRCRHEAQMLMPFSPLHVGWWNSTPSQGCQCPSFYACHGIWNWMKNVILYCLR